MKTSPDKRDRKKPHFNINDSSIKTCKSEDLLLYHLFDDINNQLSEFGLELFFFEEEDEDYNGEYIWKIIKK